MLNSLDGSVGATRAGLIHRPTSPRLGARFICPGGLIGFRNQHPDAGGRRHNIPLAAHPTRPAAAAPATGLVEKAGLLRHTIACRASGIAAPRVIPNPSNRRAVGRARKARAMRSTRTLRSRCAAPHGRGRAPVRRERLSRWRRVEYRPPAEDETGAGRGAFQPADGGIRPPRGWAPFGQGKVVPGRR